MQVEIKAQEDENFKFIEKDKPEQIDDSNVSSPTPEPVVETPVQPEPPKRMEATLNNKSGHEWFNGTSWGLK